MSLITVNAKITVLIGSKEFILTLEEAKKLYDKLGEVVGETKPTMIQPTTKWVV